MRLNRRSELYRIVMTEYIRGMVGGEFGYLDFIDDSPAPEPVDPEETVSNVLEHLAQIRGE